MRFLYYVVILYWYRYFTIRPTSPLPPSRSLAFRRVRMLLDSIYSGSYSHRPTCTSSLITESLFSPISPVCVRRVRVLRTEYPHLQVPFRPSSSNCRLTGPTPRAPALACLLTSPSNDRRLPHPCAAFRMLVQCWELLLYGRTRLYCEYVEFCYKSCTISKSKEWEKRDGLPPL